MLQFPKDVSETWLKIRNEEKVNWMALVIQKMDVLLLDQGESSFEECAQILRNKIVYLIYRGYHIKGKIRPLDIFIVWIPDSLLPFQRGKALQLVDQIVVHLEMSNFILLDALSNKDLKNDTMSVVIEKYVGTGSSHIVLDKSISDIHRERFIKKMGNREMKSETRNQVFTKIYGYIKEFLRVMDLLWKMYVQPMSSVNPEYHQLLFTNAFNVIDSEKGFFKNISRFFPVKEGTNYDDLFDLVIMHCFTYSIFSEYANSYPDLVKGGKDLSSYPQFITLNRKMEQELTEKNEKTRNLYDFLRVPLSHVPGFQVLVEELLGMTKKEDPLFKKLELSVHNLSDVSIYVDLKNEEIELSSKTVELSNKFKINELRDEAKRSMISFSSCMYKKERGEFVVFSDCLLLYNASMKAPFVFYIAKTGLTVSLSEKDEKIMILEASKKKFEITLYEKERVLQQKDLVESTRDACVRQLSVAKKYKERVIFQSWLEKEGGGKFSYNLKNRWHVLTADHKMTYFEKADGKVKGWYSVEACTVGKGRPKKGGKRKKGLGSVLGGRKKKKKKEKKKKKADDSSGGGEEEEEGYDCWMYIETEERVYGMIAPDPLLLDTWVRILEVTGCYRKDVYDEKEKEWHEKQIAIFTQVDKGDEETEGEG